MKKNSVDEFDRSRLQQVPTVPELSIWFFASYAVFLFVIMWVGIYMVQVIAHSFGQKPANLADSAITAMAGTTAAVVTWSWNYNKRRKARQ